jgi:hypothetical protein
MSALTEPLFHARLTAVFAGGSSELLHEPSEEGGYGHGEAV